MLRHLRSNAIAYLALFIALGGTSYAAVAVTGKQVRDRSLEGRDVKRDSLTGKEIRESALSDVPSADRARTAGSADTAARAAAADRAGDAATLGGRGPATFLPADGKASDADKLDGLDGAQLLRTTAVTTVTADTTQVSSAVYTDPQLGFILQTDEDAAAEADLYLVNPQPAGGRTLRLMRSASSPLLPPGLGALATVITNDRPTLVIDDADPSNMAQIVCAKDYAGGSSRVVCMITHSRN